MSGADGFRLGSWLSGPESERPVDDSNYPGKAFGLPETGPGSLARFGRRFAALLVDWLICYGLGTLSVVFGGVSEYEYQYVWHGTPAVIAWVIVGTVSVRFFGFTPGQFVLGLRVVSVGKTQYVGIGRAFVRMLLVLLAVPPLLTDSDGRGLQDRLTNTAVLRR
ncbi:RDD family protein [Mycolicibacterium aubagnense]|uniref:RDD family protein n=1 Tax=Mycolicibacterium aubagnense TaxID=319707 RepID=A0ABM7IKR9_9MYCO|nr:RDD family protein [Mycolicibacterium aubagnense]TLH66422.1 RDD family protein [Mycolicibacterium aubagnense]WGI31312.1 RDD family protein [Mycolicibacterium aubagnense]BBX87272.1 RDD family protein [Mycolicibacterium aubagnense]